MLLTTPLMRSLKRAYPASAIDALVFAGTEGILAGNPGLAGIILMPEQPSARESLAVIRRLWRRYDLALATQTGDRLVGFAWAAGRRSAGPVEASGFAAGFKRFALNRSYVSHRQDHRVRDVLRLAEVLGTTAVPEIVCPRGEGPYRNCSIGRLCRHPCRANVSLQTLDRRWLAGACGRAKRARSYDRCDRRSGRSRLSRRSVGR